MKILIPTDFSVNADHALKYASLLGKAMNANLILLHVYIPPITRANAAYPLITEEIGRMKSEATEKLHKMASALSEDYGISCEHRVRMGSPVGEIASEAENSHADLIVMGTLGASGLTKIIFGSNTALVIEKATCPVLAVPMGAVITLPKRIVFATNYHDSDMTTLKSLASLAKTLDAELMIVHVSKDKLKSERDLIEQFSKAVAEETGFQQPFYYVMEHTDIKKGLDLFVDSAGADLLALSTRKRSVFEKLFDSSLTKQMAYHIKIPLLAFHATVSEEDSEGGDF